MATQPPLPARRTKPASQVKLEYDPEPPRDKVRAAIALGLLFSFMGVIGYALYATHGDYEKTVEMLDKLLPALTGLIGSALGFYFGSKNNQS